MKRSAYFTANLAIKTLSSLSKADVVLHGEENIPTGSIIFVVNHFTRVETLLLPYYIYNLTSVPVWSLADASLFRGGLSKLFDMIGVVSTKDPQRDQLILGNLLTGEADWVIYPEGNMVKTKKTISKGQYFVAYGKGGHKPHTGAAWLALRTEFLRLHLLEKERTSPEEASHFIEKFSLGSLDRLRNKTTYIVPVNLTYYPIRARENIASTMAAKLVKDLPARAVEEIMIEGTMLLSGVDLDIRFGQAIPIDAYLQDQAIIRQLKTPLAEDFSAPEQLTKFFRRQSTILMKSYMAAIYDMTTINHEHLFASFLRWCPKKRIRVEDLKRRVYRAVTLMSEKETAGCYRHKSLKEEQIHLLIDDRFGKYRNFLDLALEKGIVREENGHLVKDKSKITELIDFHRGRIDNPVEVIANEVEPLKKLQRLILSLAWQPSFLIRFCLVRYLLNKERARYKRDYNIHAQQQGPVPKSSQPYLLPGMTRKVGVVLVHSYLASPKQVRRLAEHFSRRGMWVYAVRLAGHGTSHEDLAERKYEQWLDSVEIGYAIISNICRNVVLGGVAIGGCLALDLATRVKRISGVFAVCPPHSLHDFSTMFMPNLDVWNRILARIRRNALEEHYIELAQDPECEHYVKNPVYGILEVGRFLDDFRHKLNKVETPVLIVQTSDNPVVDPKGSRQVFDKIGSKAKQYCIVESPRHIVVYGKESQKVHRLIADFINNL